MAFPTDLAPKAVWTHFLNICSIPHGSGNTAMVADYIEEFARTRGISCRRDAAGNLLLKKPATSGYETHREVILQGHIDMVAVKTSDCPLDLARDGLLVDAEDGWVFAHGTSLGGDNGIAVAMALAVLEDDTLAHPALTVLLTNDEEIGMLGATAVDLSDVTARRMLNMDSEEEGVFTVSCAGGLSQTVTLPLEREEKSGLILTLTLKDLTGGHSGVEIHKERGNAIKLLTAVLRQCMAQTSASLIALAGGAKDNAIPTDATAQLLIDPAQLPAYQTLCRALECELRDRYSATDPHLTLTLSCKMDTVTENVLTADCAARLLSLAEDTPDGVIAKSRFDESLVQTSLNLGVICAADDKATLTWSVRSSVGAERDALGEMLAQAATAAGATYAVSGKYEAWEYREDSPLRDTLIATFEELFGKKPQVMGIHAGLECGPLCGKLPGLDALSFGPDMEAVHTTSERLSIASVEHTWTLLITALSRL